ncbi:MAG TPA: DUF389 domain-containing protein [Candidatus Vogelbacteria bacterium]|nr:DUF389 domain-containing protein [Candidatus Vogelbacteria bacterium]
MLKKTIFNISYPDQERVVKELLTESRESSDFYLLLGLASAITALGLLADSVIVIIGGMLVAPLLFPILGLSLSLVTSSRLGVEKFLKMIIRSVLLVVLASVVVALLFGHVDSKEHYILMEGVESNLIYFLVAFSAGSAAAFSWIRQGLSATLPGVAVAVSLVPPLSSFGVSLVSLSIGTSLNSLSMFVINLLGIILSAMVIFSISGFSNLQREEEERITEQDVEGKIREKALKEQVGKEDGENSE